METCSCCSGGATNHTCGAHSGSLASEFNSGASPVISGGKALVSDGERASHSKTATPVGKRHGKPVGKRG